MFKTLINALKVKDIRSKLIFTFGILLVVRLGCLIPVPGINNELLSSYMSSLGDSMTVMDQFTGGSLSRMAVFALNVTPYITSSIIVQLLTIAIPALEELSKDGEDGRKKINTITRYLTVGLAIMESSGLSIGFARSGMLVENNFINVFTTIVTLTAGSIFVMWLGERISEKGVGNGISIVLLINIVSRMPSDFVSLYEMFVQGKPLAKGIMAAVVIIGVIIITTILVVLLQDGERRIPVQYAKKVQGRKLTGGQTSYIPLKVNTAGVIPVIFASSLLSIPSIIISLFKISIDPTSVWSKIITGMSSNNWFNKSYPWANIGLLVYMALVVMFAFFYTSITFNPMEVANNIKKSGGFIPGIRPGKPTQDYLQKILNYIIIIGVIGLLLVAIIPIFFNGVFNASVSFGGTSLIIVVGVIIETIKQLESQLLVRHYSGFLND